MNIKLLAVSPFPPIRTGIAEYAHEFYKALSRELELIILTNKTDINNDFHSNTKFELAENIASFKLLKHIIKLVNKHNITYVHIQVGLRTFGNHMKSSLITLASLALLRLMGRKPIVTLHTIPTKWALIAYFNGKIKKKTQAFLTYLVYKLYLKIVAKLSWKIVVHLDVMKKYLIVFHRVKQGKIEVLPHGTTCLKETINKNNEGLLFHGFLRESKGLNTLLDAYISITNRGVLSLRIIGPLHMGEVDYLRSLITKIRKLEKAKKIRVKPKHLNLNEIIEEIGKAKIIVLPYEDYFLEASGVLAKAACSGTPIICSKIPKFYFEKDYRRYITFFEPGNKEDLRNKIIQVLDNYEIYKVKAKKLRNIAKKRTWDKIAKKFAKIITLSEKE